MAKKTKMVSPYEYKTGRVYADSKVWFCIAATRVSIISDGNRVEVPRANFDKLIKFYTTPQKVKP